MPVFNGELYLAEALDAELAQTFGDFELIISDNASTDGTEEICRQFALRDSRIRYIRQPDNRGAAQNYNLLVDHARGEFFRWAAHDDIAAPTFLERTVAALNCNPEAVLAFTNTSLINEAGRLIERYRHETPWRGVSPSMRLRDLVGYPRSYLQRCFPIFGLIRVDALRRTRRIGPFEGADRVTLVELSMIGDFIRVPEYLFARREHPDSSRRLNSTALERLRWFDTNASTRYPLPRTTVAKQTWMAVNRATLSWHDRVRCRAVLLRWLLGSREGRVIAGELRAAGRHWWVS